MKNLFSFANDMVRKAMHFTPEMSLDRRRYLLILSCFLIIPLSNTGVLYAQTLRLVQQISQKPIVAVSVDTYDRLITADTQGNITAYDTLGKALYSYSPVAVADVTLLEAWRSMQMLVFYRDLQQYTLLDRFLTPLSGYPNPAKLPTDIGFARVMTLAYDDQFWVFDDSEFSLKKFNAQRQTVVLNIPLTLVLHTQDYQITFMREYQNQLFVADRNSGVLVFDNLGNYRRTLPFKGVGYFQFAGEELYFLENNRLHFYNLYSQTERKMELSAGTKWVVLAGHHLFVCTDKGVFLYRQF